MPRSNRKRKRPKFKGNRYTVNNVSTDVIEENVDTVPVVEAGSAVVDDEVCSSSAKKLNILTGTKNDEDVDTTKFYEHDYNVIVNFSILQSIFGNHSYCPECENKLHLSNDLKKRRGLCFLFELNCSYCGWTERFETSQDREIVTGPGKRLSSINMRTVFAFRELGKGHAAMKSFARCMNMPPPMTTKTYNNINNVLHNAYEDTAKESTFLAAKETKKKISPGAPDDSVVDCQVSLDGTWQKRGHASINGVVTLMSKENGKCIDTYTLSKKCQACHYWEGKTNKPGYFDWKNNHVCNANHDKSSGAMEGAGAVKMFGRSIEKNNLRYTSYIGDGDTSSFNEVVASQPYGADIVIDKKECVGHVQKRMGNRLRTLRQSKKGAVLSDGGKIMGKGRLTDKAINTLQNYYGMAIRQNTDSIYAMKKSVWAVLYHNSKIDDLKERHKFCPRTPNSWCLWQSDQLTGESKYKVKLSLPLAINELLIPIFRNLSSEDLLSRCLHGQTQNNNESINNLIWNKCPKNTYVSRKIIEMAVDSAVIEFNNGATGLYGVLKRCGIKCGRFMDLATKRKDSLRLRNMNLKSSKRGIGRRKKLRAIRKGFIDAEKHVEGETYAPGAF